MDHAIADAQRCKRKPIRGGTDKPREASSLVIAEDPDSQDTKVTQMEVHEMRAGTRSFKKPKPYEVAETSDEAMQQLILFFKRCEREGGWPQEWGHPCLVCIPKEKEGEFRLIALLHMAYRIWAKAAARQVSRWMGEISREWIAFGPGCAAEDAAYDVCLRTEAAEGQGMHTITMISDL